MTLTGVSLPATNIRFIFAVARGFDHITFIVSCAVYRLFCSSIIHSHRVMQKLRLLDLTRQSLTHHCARLSTQFWCCHQFMLQCVHLTSHVSRCVCWRRLRWPTHIVAGCAAYGRIHSQREHCYKVFHYSRVLAVERITQLLRGDRADACSAVLSPAQLWYDIFVNCNWVATRWQ